MARLPSQLQQIVETDVTALRRRLRYGEIVPARVSRVLGDGHYAIVIRGETVHAQSHLALETGELYAIVEGLNPRIRLRLIPMQNNRGAEKMIRLALDNDLSLDPFTQSILSRFIGPDMDTDNLPAFVEGCRQLETLRPRTSRISIESLLDVIFTRDDFLRLTTLAGELEDYMPRDDKKGPDLLALFLDLYNAHDSILAAPYEPPVDPADEAEFGWLTMRVTGQSDLADIVAPRDLTARLKAYSNLLLILNSRQCKAFLQAWLTHDKQRLRLNLIEQWWNDKMLHAQTWLRSDIFGEIRLEIQKLNHASRATLVFDNTYAVREFKRVADDLRASVEAHLPGCMLNFELDRPEEPNHKGKSLLIASMALPFPKRDDLSRIFSQEPFDMQAARDSLGWQPDPSLDVYGALTSLMTAVRQREEAFQ